jgi:hypothetical protein
MEDMVHAAFESQQRRTLIMHPKISRAFKDFSGGMGTFRMGLVLLLAVALLGTETAPAFAQAPQTPDPSTVENQVKKFGVGKSVKVWLVGGEFVRGHIRGIGADSFTVKVSKTSTERSIPYAQVAEIKDPPGPITYILIGAAIVVVAILIIHH